MGFRVCVCDYMRCRGVYFRAWGEQGSVCFSQNCTCPSESSAVGIPVDWSPGRQ